MQLNCLINSKNNFLLDIDREQLNKRGFVISRVTDSDMEFCSVFLCENPNNCLPTNYEVKKLICYFDVKDVKWCKMFKQKFEYV